MLATRIGTGRVALAVFGCLVTAIDITDDPAVIQHNAPPPRECSGWIPSPLPPLDFVDIERVAADDAWLLAPRGLFHWDGCAWRAHAPFAEIAHRGITWFDIAVDDAGFIWLRGGTPERRSSGPRGWCGFDRGGRARNYAYVLQGTKWREMDPKLAPPRARGREVTAFGREREIVAMSGGADDQWAIVAAPPRMRVRPYDHASGTVREVWRYVGQWWIPIHVPASSSWEGKRIEGETLHDMTVYARGGSGPHNAWVVGRQDGAPEVRRYDGWMWTSHRSRLPVDDKAFLTAVWSGSRDATWVVGQRGLVMHWDGGAWTVLPPPMFGMLDSVYVEDGVLVVGGDGGVFRYRL